MSPRRSKEPKRREPCERCGLRRYLRYWWGEELCAKCIVEEFESNTIEFDDGA